MIDSTPEIRQEHAIEVGARLAAAREAAFAKLASVGAGALDEYVAAMDAAVAESCKWAFQHAARELGIEWDGEVTGFAIAAVGGYGRYRLAPFSDIDIAVIVPDEEDPLVQRAVSHAYHVLIDAAHKGLGVADGYAYYALNEEFELDERTLSALLDARLIAGSRDLVTRLEEEVYRQLEGPLFLQWNHETRRQARARFGDVLHLQEPNIKESPGGLRDLQCALWSASSVWRRPPAQMLQHLVTSRHLRPELAEAAQAAQDFNWTIRSFLHLSEGRKRDVLALDSHDAAAETLGYFDEDGKPSPNALMTRYYAEAEALEQISRQIFGLCEGAQIDVGDGYYVQDHLLWTNDWSQLRHSPERALKAFELALKYNVGLSRTLARHLEAAQPIVEQHRGSPEAAASFLQLLKAGPRANRILRMAQETGVLQAYIPEFGVALRWSSGEPMHKYTVGEHLLRTVERLDIIANDEDDFGHHVQVFSEIDRPEVLTLAALMHDIGRIEPDRPHSEVGAEITLRVGKRIGMSRADVEDAAELVRKHLILDRVATLRDVSDEATMRNITEQVGNVEFLKRLYLLTTADIMAVGPGLWTDVRRDQLEDLYFRMLKHLVEDEPLVASQEDMARLRERTTDTLMSSGRLPVGAVKRHCKQMPDSYFTSTQVGLIGVHVGLIERLADEKTVIDVYAAEKAQYTELTVVRHDDDLPGLFARLCAAVYANELDIHDARIYTRKGEHAIVVDSLWLTWQGRPAPEAKAEALHQDLLEVLDGGVDPEALLARKGRPRPVSLDIWHLDAHNDESDTHTVIEATGRDQMGFLYCVTAALSEAGLNIHTAKITTRGRRAIDAFYVTNAQGQKLSDDEAREAERALARLLGED